MTNQLAELWPIVAFFIILIMMLMGMMVLSYFLGPKTQTRAKNTPYESGIIAAISLPKNENQSTQDQDKQPQINNRTRFSNHFFLYAIFFVIFDLETIFLFSWVIAFDEVGLAGFVEASIFITILLAGLIYLWRIGALELKLRHQNIRQRLSKHSHQPSSHHSLSREQLNEKGQQ